MCLPKWMMAMAAAAAMVGPATAQPLEKVSLELDWIVNGTHAGYFVAKARGYYRDAGLDVDISRGYGSGDTVKHVGSAGVMFGIADASTVIALRANYDVPVRMVAMVYGKAPLGIIYLAESGIKDPRDIMGRKIARTASGSSVVMFPAFMKANGIDRSKVEEIVADANTMLPLLMSRRADAVLGQTVHVERFKKIARQQGTTVKIMNYSDYGLDAYGNALVASTDVIAAKPELVSRFVDASIKGIRDALARPEQAVAIEKQMYSETDTEVLTDEIAEVTPVIVTDEAKVNGIGFASDGRLQKTIDNVDDALGLKRRPEPGDVFTASFLPKNPVLLK
jgi:NitT/TauT family transport system substrate-binding protein